MIKKSDVEAVIDYQKDSLKNSKGDVSRLLLNNLSGNTENFALVISGIRRAGKSTLLKQLIQNTDEKTIYINFDTPRLYNFTLSDFEIIDLIIQEKKAESLFFDEIQIIEGWEVYVKQKLDEKFDITVTGSNASLLSRELGTRLTGRHISKEIFPFSYPEYLSYKKEKNTAQSFAKFLESGGFPEYLRTNNAEVLQSLLNDILHRDIAVRYNIRDVSSLKKLIIYLFSNVGNLVTANKLTDIIGVKSNITVLDYFSYFEQSYLVNLLPKFSYSNRAQLVNPRKIYVIDNGLVNAATASLSSNLGRKLENVIYWHLRQQTNELFYFNEKNSECDFVVFKNNKLISLIQVCYELNHENTRREVNGLLSAMDFFNVTEGTIVTLNQNDLIIDKDKKIKVVPAYTYCNDY